MSKKKRAGEHVKPQEQELPPGVKLLRTLEGHTDIVYSVAFESSGEILASGSGDNTVKLWEVASGKLLRTLEGHKNSVYSVVFDPTGRTLASGSDDRTVKLWDVVSGKLPRILEGHEGGVNSMAFDPEGRVLATSHSFTVLPPPLASIWPVGSNVVLQT